MDKSLLKNYLKKIKLHTVLLCMMLLCGVIAVWFSWQSSQKKQFFLQENASILQKHIAREINNVQQATQKIENKKLANFDFEQCTEITDLLNIKTAVYIYKHDSLIFWNSSQIDIHLPDEVVYKPTGIVSDAAKPVYHFLQNNGVGVVQCAYRLPTSGYLVVALVPIQYEKNANQLQYFKNEFVVKLLNPQDLRLTQADESGGTPIFANDNTTLFKLKLTTSNNTPLVIDVYKKQAGIAILSLVFLLLLYIILHDDQMKAYIPNKPLRLLSFVFIVLCVRVWFFVFKDEIGINGEVNELFSASIFANSDFTPSLGDLLLHIFAFMFVAMYAYKQRLFFKYWKVHIAQTTHPFVPIFIDWLVSSAIIIYLLHIAYDLVINSNIPFGAADFFNLTSYSIAIYAIFIIIGGIAIYQIANTTLEIQRYKLGMWFLVLQIVLTFSFFIEDLGFKRYIPLLVFAIFGVVLWVGIYLKKRRISSIALILFVALSIAITLQTSMALYQKQTARAKLIAENIQYPTDAIAEKQLLELATKLQTDTALLHVIPQNINIFKNKIIGQYFTNVLKKYTFDTIYIKKGIKKSELFDEMNSLSFQGKVQSTAEIARITQTTTLPFVGKSGSIDTLKFKIYKYAFEPQKNNNTQGFNFDYSVGIYKNRRLIARKGSYMYNLKDTYFSRSDKTDYVLRNDFWDLHVVKKLVVPRSGKYSKKTLFYMTDDTYYVIISFKNPLMYDFFVGVSSLLLAFLLAYYIFNMTYKLYKNIQFWRNINYRSKISILLTASVIFTLLFVGVVTIIYTFGKYRQTQYRNLTQNADNLTVNLKELDNQEFIFYDPLGVLQPNQYSNSQIEVPMPKHINPQAYYDIISLGKSVQVQTENYGSLSYLTCYVPVLDASKNLVGIVGFPDFSADEDLKDNLSGFLGTLLNIYVLILLILVAFILFASAKITAPLRLITRVISNTHLKQKLPKLDEINRNDEIGEMIREYYKKIEEVEHSAAQLAQAEKDMAWREMAKQIAHEIRNPLTPMKLRIQHLQKVYKDKSDDFPTIFAQVSSGVLEQINTLESVASEFGEYARTGTKPHATIDLNLLCRSAATLYEQVATIRYINQTNTPNALIQGSEEELMRVLTNLIRNATQSREDTENIVVNVWLYDNINHFVIQINDNGTGIPVAIQANIFQPNFTTKTSGMGLGLAIVRRIVEHHGGDIRFDSRVYGTSFFVSIPKLK